ncbi:MAG: diadenylate cyclase [Chloroflexia bacterium]
MPELFWLATRLDGAAALDILVVAAIFFWLLTIAQGTRAVSLIRGALILIALLVVISTILPLPASPLAPRPSPPSSSPSRSPPSPSCAAPWNNSGLGYTGSRLNLPFVTTDHPHPGLTAIDEIVNAVSALGRQRIGALIVIERETGWTTTWTRGSSSKPRLPASSLINIFFKNSPLHDGAVIVRGDRIVAARCIMPLSEEELPGQFGTRHCAALGISEESDAVAVIVSEQSWGIFITHDGKIERDLSSEHLRQDLVDLVVYETPHTNGSLVGRFRSFRSYGGHRTHPQPTQSPRCLCPLAHPLLAFPRLPPLGH